MSGVAGFSTRSKLSVVHQGIDGFDFGAQVEPKRFQTFVASPECTGTLRISTKLRRLSGSGKVFVDLYPTVDGTPSGASLSGGTLSEIGDGFSCAEGDLEVASLVPGAEYAVVLSTNASSRFEWATAPVFDDLHFGMFDGEEWIDESGLGDGWLHVTPAAGGASIDIVHRASKGGAQFGHPGDQRHRFQTFVAGESGPAHGIEVMVRRGIGNRQSDIIAGLFATDRHRPCGEPLATADIPAGRVGKAWRTVHADLPAGLELDQDREYAVVLSQRNPNLDAYEWAAEPANHATYLGRGNGSDWVDESWLGDGWLRILRHVA